LGGGHIGGGVESSKWVGAKGGWGFNKYVRMGALDS